MTAAASPFVIDPDRSTIALFVGRKGSGKSYAAERLYRAYPNDKLVLDITGDADPPGAVLIDEPAAKMPEGEDDEPVNLRYKLDPGSHTFLDDADRAVGMALYPKERPSLLWVDEMGMVTSGNKTGPHTRRLLMASRHYRASALLCCPRPIDIDKLCVMQADLVFVYDLPDPDDRIKIAKCIGYPPVKFSEECDATFRRGDHWFLLWVTKEHRLYRMPPLPLLGAT